MVGGARNPQVSAWAIIDDSSRKPFWREFIGTNNLNFIDPQQLEAGETTRNEKRLQWTVTKRPTAIIINADIHLLGVSTNGSSTPIRSGTGWAIRLRQEQKPFECPIILVSFRRLADALADPLDLKTGGERISNDHLLEEFFAEDWQVAWHRFPQAREQLEQTIEKQTDRYVRNASGLLRLGHEICSKMVERENKRFRHRQGSFSSVVRVLLGAVQAGHVTTEDAFKLVNDLRQNPKAADYDFRLMERCLALGDRLNIRSASALPSNKENRHILLVDDNAETAGWKAVLEFIFRPWKFVTLLDGEPIKNGELRDLERYDLVLLDYDLGISTNKKSGLDVLDEIRARNLFIPVVMFTGVDNSALYNEAINRGATGFLLKELADPQNRSSLQYYEYFKSEIIDVLQFRNETFSNTQHTNLKNALAMVRAAGQSINACNYSQTNKNLLTDALVSLERAIFFIQVASGFVGVKRLKKGNKQNLAAVRVVSANFAIVLDIMHDVYCDPVDTTKSGDKAEQLYLNAKRNILPYQKSNNRLVEHFEKLENIAKLIRSINHGRVYQRSLVDLSRFSVSLATCLAATIATHAKQSLPLNVNFRPRPKPFEATAYDFDKPSSHEERAIQGCLRFILGYYLECGGLAERAEIIWLESSKDFSTEGTSERRSAQAIKSIMADNDLWKLSKQVKGQKKRRALIIDDTAADDGWLDALRFALTEFDFVHLGRIPEEELTKARVLEEAKSSDIILLDLQLPRPRKSTEIDAPWGVELLKGLRKSSAGFDKPIIIFSAHDAVLWSRKCHALGAQAVFTKFGSMTQSKAPSAEFFKSYYRTLRDHLQLKSPETKRLALYDTVYRLSLPSQYKLLNGRAWANEAVSPLGTVSKKRPVAEILGRFIYNELTFLLDMVWIAEDVHAAVLARELFLISDNSPRPNDNKDIIQAHIPRELAILGAACVERLLKLLIDITRAVSNRIASDDPRVPPSLAKWVNYIADAGSQFFPNLQGSSFVLPCRELSELRNSVLYRGSDPKLHPDFIIQLVEKITIEIVRVLNTSNLKRAS